MTDSKTARQTIIDILYNHGWDAMQYPNLVEALHQVAESQVASLESSLAEKEADLAHMTKLKEGFENHSWELAERNNAQLAQLQLENGVMRDGLKYYVDNCNHNPCDCLIARKALSLSTKSSLMEKVRAAFNRLQYDLEQIESYGHVDDRRNQIARSSLSALTEVKKAGL